jgi:uncharacterized LabA/DUF88 family protein
VNKSIVSPLNKAPANYNPFGLVANEPTVVLIDGTSTYYATREVNFDIDYKTFRTHFQSSCDLRRMVYYSVVRIEEDGKGNEKNNPLVPTLTWMAYNGIRTVTNEKFVREGSQTPIKMGNMLPQIATDIMRHAEFAKHIVVLSGANDLAYPIDAARDRYGCKVTGACVIKLSGKQGYMGDEFRRACDTTVEFNDDFFMDVFEKKRERD